MQFIIAFFSRLEETSDVISGENVGQIGVGVPVQFGGSRSHRSRDIRLPFFVTNDDNDTGVRRSSHKDKRLVAFYLKKCQRLYCRTKKLVTDFIYGLKVILTMTTVFQENGAISGSTVSPQQNRLTRLFVLRHA